MQNKSKILVDGNCIVCDFEVAHYKKLAPHLFDIIDIAAPDFDAKKYHLTTEAVNLHMHVLTPENQVLIGVDAFVHIWSQIPRYRLAKKIIQLPLIHSLSKLGYEIFARYIRRILPKKNRG